MTPHEAMKLAIEEGHKGAGFVSPNPLVGCVILDGHGKLIGQGHHARVGEAHAEINALKSVQDSAALKGAHVYVTLEPCAHQGRTPSCARKLAELPLASVTFGLVDPDPRVSGQGAEIVRQAGIEVRQFSELQAELEELAEIFLLNHHLHRPFVAVKVGVSSDGKMAYPDGRSQWITGEESRAYVQYLRGCYDAVLIGVGTFLADNPRLNARDPRFAGRASKVVLVDPKGRSLPRLKDSALLQVRSREDVYLISEVATDLGVRRLNVPQIAGRYSAQALLAQLQAEGIRSVFIEGGAQTYASFYNSDLVDRLYFFQAPKAMGEGLSWSAGIQPQKLKLRNSRTERFGPDTLTTGRV